MPTYQYACTECGHAFEQFQSFTDDALTECPECGGRLRKLFNAVGVVFKGSGLLPHRQPRPGPVRESLLGGVRVDDDRARRTRTSRTRRPRPSPRPNDRAAPAPRASAGRRA